MCEASSKFHKRRFQNERFARGLLKFSQKKLPKGAFRAKLPTIFTEEGSKMIVSCEASSKFKKRRFQNERFARGFVKISQKKLPKWLFRARLQGNFTEKASKMIVSCEASDKFHRKQSFQNERFARCFRQFSQKKLPKGSFRARHLPNFIKQSFRNEHFARCFRQFSRKKLPKWSFRARLPPNFIEQCCQNTIVHTPRTMRGAIPRAQN